MEVGLWSQATSPGARQRSPVPALQRDVTTRNVCTATSNRKLLDPNGAGTYLRGLQGYFAPDALDAVRQGRGQLSHSRSPNEAIGGYVAEFDLHRRKPGRGGVQHGGAYPDAFGAALCSQNANPPNCEEPSVLASTPSVAAMVGDAQQVRRLFWLFGAPAEKDVPMAENGGSQP